ncbi:MAG: LCP family protein, partial [Firmicutes bacterium]|nr:LCP family protein [Bacillota bacterium]
MFKISKKIIIIAVAVFALATVGLTLLRGGEDGGVLDIPIFEQSDTKLSKDMTPIVVDETSPFYEVFQSKDRVNLLLLGVNQGMTDVIMVCSYDMENQYVNLISVPRDTFYYRPGLEANYAGNKINAIYHSEGIVPLAEAVSKTLYGMPLHYYAIVEYADIEKVMDVIGGVQVDVPFDMIYDDPTDNPPLHIRIYAGEQTIDSSNVMEYLRYRKGYRNGDIGRIQVHQEFVKKVIKECLKAGNILDVAKVAVENVESDITYSMAISVATKAFKLSGDSINSYVLPGTDAMIQGFSFWQPNEDGVFQMLEEIYRIGSGE